MHSVAELRLRARARLPRVYFSLFIDGGAAAADLVAADESAFQDLRLLPRVFAPCRNRDLATTLLGQRYALPFGVTPMGLCDLAWPGTDLGLARRGGQGWASPTRAVHHGQHLDRGCGPCRARPRLVSAVRGR